MKLKTLNDIFSNEANQYERIIKQEAIKWVKKIIEECSLFRDCEICKQKVDWIKHFFNITEEDLSQGMTHKEGVTQEEPQEVPK